MTLLYLHGKVVDTLKRKRAEHAAAYKMKMFAKKGGVIKVSCSFI